MNRRNVLFGQFWAPALCSSPQGPSGSLSLGRPKGMEGAGSFLWRGCGINITVVGGRDVERKHWKPSIFLLFFLFLSKGIADYITRCKQAIGKFESLVHQIHKNADDISSRLTLIESINLFKYPAPKSEDELPGRSGFYFLLIMGGKVSWLWLCTHTHILFHKWNKTMSHDFGHLKT